MVSMLCVHVDYLRGGYKDHDALEIARENMATLDLPTRLVDLVGSDLVARSRPSGSQHRLI